MMATKEKLKKEIEVLSDSVQTYMAKLRQARRTHRRLELRIDKLKIECSDLKVDLRRAENHADACMEEVNDMWKAKELIEDGHRMDKAQLIQDNRDLQEQLTEFEKMKDKLQLYSIL